MISIDQIRKLREETDLSISECKKALEEAKGNFDKAKEILRTRGKEFAKEKEKREVGQGVVECYVHPGKRIGAMIELRCETDFVARSTGFQKFAHELCLQLAAVSSGEIPFVEQPWIRDESKKIKDLIAEQVAKFGENIVVKNFIRYEI